MLQELYWDALPCLQDDPCGILNTSTPEDPEGGFSSYKQFREMGVSCLEPLDDNQEEIPFEF